MDSILIFEVDRIYRIHRILDTRFPDETGYMQSASQKNWSPVSKHCFYSH